MNREMLQETIDRRLRRDLLSTIRSAQASTADGYIAGMTLYDLHGPGSPPINQARDEQHLLELLTRLELHKLVEHQDRRVYREEKWGLNCTLWRVTERGVTLLEETIEPIPAVFDRRRPQQA